MEEVNNSMVQKNIILQATNIKAQATVKSSQFYKGFSSLDEGSITTKQYDFDVRAKKYNAWLEKLFLNEPTHF